MLLAAPWAATLSGCGRPATVSLDPGPKVAVVSRDETAASHNAEALVLTCVLANRGDADLRLGPISTSCGCSSAKISRELVPPGETAVLAVEGLPPASGSRPVQIHVTTNDPRESRLTLAWNLVGHPNPPKLLTPELAIDLGILRPGQIPPARSVVFEVLEDREAPPIVRGASVDPESCRVEGGMIDEVNAADPKLVTRSYRYQVSFLRAPAVGPFARRVEVLRRDEGAGPWLSIPIRGIVLPVVRALPASVRFVQEPTGGKMSAKLMIICDDQSGALAAECIAHDPRMTARVLRREPDRVLFEVECKGLGDDRALRPLHFRIDQPVSATIEVPVHAFHAKLEGDLP